MMYCRCSGYNKLRVSKIVISQSSYTHVVGVEGQRIGSTLRTAPEWLTSARNSIFRQAVQQLTNAVVVLVLELQTSPDDTLFEGERLVGDEIRHNLLKELLRLARVLEAVLEEVGFSEIGVDGCWRSNEKVIELFPCPLKRVLALGTVCVLQNLGYLPRWCA